MAVPLIATPNLLTLTGGLITDTTRTTGTEGDGAAVPGGVGIYEAYTNDCINGNAATNTNGWSLFNGAEALTRDTTPANAVFGSTSFKVVTVGNPSDGVYYNLTGLTAGTVKTCSLTGRFNAGRAYRLLAIDNGGTTVATTTFTGTGARQTVSVTGTVPVGKTALAFTLLVNQSGVDTWYFGGVEINTGSIAFPYKHTAGSTATNTAGRIQASSYLLNATQGWAAFRVTLPYASTSLPAAAPYFLAWVDGSSHLGCSLQSGPVWQLRRYNGSTLDLINVAASFAANATTTFIVAWTATTLSISINGGAFTSAASTIIPTLTTANADLGSFGTSNQIDGTLRAAATGTGTLSNADAATIRTLLAAVANRTRLPTYPDSLGVTAIWPGVDAGLWVPDVTRGGLTGDLRVRSRYAGTLEVAV